MRKQRPDRNIAKKAFMKDENRFRILFEKSADAQFLLDGNVFIDCNDAALQMMRCTRKEELVGHHADDFAPHTQPDGQPSLDKATEMIGNALDRGSHRFEWVHRRADGTDFPAEVALTAVPVNGKPLLHGGVRDATEREPSQRALRESEQKYRDLAELLPQTVFEIDGAGRIIFVNNQGLQYFGYIREDFEKGIWLPQVIAPEDYPRAMGDMSRVLEGEERVSAEYTAVRKNGTRFPVIISATPIVEQGKPFGLRGIATDITDRKKTEEALRQSEERFRLTFDQSPIGAALLTVADGHFARTNRAFCRFTAHSEEELAQLTFAGITHPDDVPLSLEQTRRLLAGEIDGFEIEKRYIRKDGSIAWGHLSAQTVKDGYGRILYTLAMIQDITERKKTEQALMESEERYRTVIEHSNDGVVITRGGRHVYVNQRFLNMFDYNGPEEIRGKSIADARHVHPEDRAWLEDMNKRRWKGEPTPSRYVHRAVGKDGTVLYVEASSTRITYQGEPASLSYLRDITERRQAEEALKRSEEAALRLAQETGVIAEIGRIISSSLDIEEVYERFAEEVRKLIPFDRILVNLASTQEGTLTTAYSAGMAVAGRRKGVVFPVAGTVTEEMIRTGVPALFHPESIEEVRSRFPGLVLAFQAGLRSRLSVLLIARGEVIGSLALWSKQLKAYGERDISLAQSVASQIAGALANAWLFRERKRAEDELQKERETFFTILENDPTGVALIGKNGVYQYLNPEFTNITGYSLEDVRTGKEWFEKAYPDPHYRQKVIDAWKMNRLSHGGRQDLGFTVSCKDGRKKEIEFRTTFLRDCSVVVLNDVTTRRQAEQELKESEARFKQLFDSVSDGIAVRDAQTLELLDVNRRFCEMWGYTFEELKGLPLGSLGAHESVEERRARLIAYYEQAAKGAANLFEWAAKRKDGSTFRVELNGTKITIGTRDCLLLVVRDITARKRSEEALAASEERYRRVVESSPSAIFVDCRSYLVFVNPAATRLLGAVECEQLRGRPLLDFVRAESKEMLQRHIDSLLQGSQTFLLRNVQLTGLNGALLDVEITGIAFDYEGEPAVQLVVHDVTEARQKAMQLEHMARHDVLTSLPNRVMMRDRLNEALAHVRRYGGHVTVIFLDLDHFKIINDSLGHDQGDIFLRTIANRLSGCVREVDTVARFGGDEFVIVLFDQSKDNDALMRVLERIQGCIRQPVSLAGREYTVSSSIGFAMYPRDGSDVETLLRNADEAMYRAKDQGRDNFQPYAEELHVRVTERLKLHNDLRRAVERDEFIVHYQPQADLASGSIIAVEALVRWRHPDRGLMAPSHFIDAAEETGLITRIGEFVLRTACEQGMAWQDMGFPSLRVAVNLSSRQFWQPDLLEMVERSLRDSGLNPHLLELELTESLILKGVDDAVRTMQALRTMGVELAIDDFGTGYSSLAYLKRFPIGRLKIAQAFLHDIPADPDNAAIARAVISLGHNLKLKVVAEGVETPQQLKFLEDAGCDEIQGYLISKPLPQGEATELLKMRLLRVNGGGSQAA